MKCDILVWLNPIAPLQTHDEIRKVTKYFINSKYDSLITSIKKQVHAKYKNKPLNYKKNQKFKKTQELNHVELMVYSLMMWKSKSFLKSYKNIKSGILCGNTTTYLVDELSGVIVKYINDLRLIETIINSNENKKVVKYDKLVRNIK